MTCAGDTSSRSYGRRWSEALLVYVVVVIHDGRCRPCDGPRCRRYGRHREQRNTNRLHHRSRYVSQSAGRLSMEEDPLAAARDELIKIVERLEAIVEILRDDREGVSVHLLDDI